MFFVTRNAGSYRRWCQDSNACSHALLFACITRLKPAVVRRRVPWVGMAFNRRSRFDLRMIALTILARDKQTRIHCLPPEEEASACRQALVDANFGRRLDCIQCQHSRTTEAPSLQVGTVKIAYHPLLQLLQSPPTFMPDVLEFEAMHRGPRGRLPHRNASWHALQGTYQRFDPSKQQCWTLLLFELHPADSSEEVAASDNASETAGLRLGARRTVGESRTGAPLSS